MLYCTLKTSRQGDDGACAAQADEILAIRAEIATAGIQAFNPAGIPHNSPIRGDR
jgi:hypothetical protein